MNDIPVTQHLNIQGGSYAEQDRKAASRNGGGSSGEVEHRHPQVGGQGVPQGRQGQEGVTCEIEERISQTVDDDMALGEAARLRGSSARILQLVHRILADEHRAYEAERRAIITYATAQVAKAAESYERRRRQLLEIEKELRDA